MWRTMCDVGSNISTGFNYAAFLLVTLLEPPVVPTSWMEDKLEAEAVT